MSGNERTGFAHYGFGRAAAPDDIPGTSINNGVGAEVGTGAGAGNGVRIVPRRPNRLGLLLESINDRLPVTLQGRWRLDRRSGTALAVAVALGAVVPGGWALFRAQYQPGRRPRLLAAGHSARPGPPTG